MRLCSVAAGAGQVLVQKATTFHVEHLVNKGRQYADCSRALRKHFDRLPDATLEGA